MLYDRDAAAPDNPNWAANLRPKTVPQIMDNTFRIYRDNAAPLLMLSALLIVPLNIVSALVASMTYSGMTEAQLRDLSPAQQQAFLTQNGGLFCLGLLIAFALGLAQTVILNGTVVTITSESLFGVRLTLREAWQKTQPRFGDVFASYLLFGLSIGLLTVVVVVVSVLCPFLLVVLSLVFYVSITAGSMIVQVAVLEGARDRIARPHLLAKSRFWQVLGISILIGLVSFVIGLIVEAIFGVLFSSPALQTGTTGVVANITLQSVSAILIAPLVPIVMTQMYYDARIRKEGLADTLIALGPEARPKDVQPIHTDEPIFSGQDILNIVVVFGIVIVLSLVAGALLSSILDVLVPGMGDLSSFSRPA